MTENHEVQNDGETAWQVSTFCANSGCVQVRRGQDLVEVRSSLDPDHGTVSYSHEEWRAFVAGVKAGEFDV